MTTKINENQINIWREQLFAHKAAKEAKEEMLKKMIESGEMYENIVDETLGFIIARVDKEIKSPSIIEKAVDGIVTISIYSALVITPDLHVYTATGWVPRNPKTQKDYFFDPHYFKDEEQVNQFFKDVKEQLTEAVKFSERKATRFECPDEGGRAYDVEVKINLND